MLELGVLRLIYCGLHAALLVMLEGDRPWGYGVESVSVYILE